VPRGSSVRHAGEDSSCPGEPDSLATVSIPRAQSFNLANIGHDLFKIALESREHPDERGARLRREQDDAEHQRRKEMAILWSVLITVGVVSVIRLGIVLISGQPAENAKWATTLLTTVVSGGSAT
jgi:hypothetical protein